MYLRSGNWNQYNNCFNVSTDTMNDSLINHLNEIETYNNVQKLIYADIKDRLCFDFLFKVDMGTMAHSLEARSPFLDYRLFEFAFSLDHKVLYHGFNRKAILKKIAQKYLTKSYINRRKMGFSIPKYSWLINPKNYKHVKMIINRRSSLDTIMSRLKIKEIIKEFEMEIKVIQIEFGNFLSTKIWDGLFISKVYTKKSKLYDID